MKFGLLIALSLILSSCGGGGGGGLFSSGGTPKTYERQNAIMNLYRSSNPLDRISFEKMSSKQQGFAIFEVDPQTGPNRYFAVQINNLTDTEILAFDDFGAFAADLIAGNYYPELDRFYIETRGEGANAYDVYGYHGSIGNGLVRFSTTRDQIKDLETLASLEEETDQQLMAQTLKAQFSLSASRSDELAKMTIRFQKISSQRALTSDERDLFAMDALGVSFNDVTQAIQNKVEGDSADYDQMLEDAARFNGTTAENIDLFLSQFN